MRNEEDQRYGRNKETVINHAYIESGEYRRKFDIITESPAVNRVLYEKAKAMLYHRSGTLFEDMYWIDGDTGAVIARITDSLTQQKVVYSKAVWNSIKNRENLITVHNHPGSLPPSVADFNSAFWHSYRLGIVLCHDGRIYAYTAQEEISERIAELYAARLHAEADEFAKQMYALQRFKEQGMIDFWEVRSNETRKI